MLDEMNDGGPAFPCTDEASYEQPNRGMTLRDYFAAQAMNAFLRDVQFAAQPIDRDTQRILDSAAQHSYAMADAMLKARGPL